MVNLDIKSDMVKVDEYKDPVVIRQEDLTKVKEIQEHLNSLSKYRQELGRLEQAKYNLVQHANEIETTMAHMRRALVKEYGLESQGTAQWAIDFEKNQFVKLDPSAPVIP